MNKRIRTSLLLLGLVAALPTSPARAEYWTPWVSDEGGEAFCTTWAQAAVGFGCSGSYCDRVRVLCEDLPAGFELDSSTHHWTAYFSEERSVLGTFDQMETNMAVCHDGDKAAMMTGVRCLRGKSYCDSVSLECVKPVTTAGVDVWLSGCKWTDKWLSEEDGGTLTLEDGQFISGVQCDGSYCDRKKFLVCSWNFNFSPAKWFDLWCENS